MYVLPAPDDLSTESGKRKGQTFSRLGVLGTSYSWFGDPHAQLYVLGLAPAAHGGNRTGRVFTRDRSGDWLYEALHAFGFANQPESIHREDGLALKNCYVAAAVRCARLATNPLKKNLKLAVRM